MARDGWGVEDVRQRCSDLRAVLADSPECCTAEELTAYWPGGEQNRQASRGGWIYCYAQYCAFLRRAETTPGQQDQRRAIADQAARDALRGAPEPVELDERDEFGVPKTVAIFPKSFHALAVLDEYDGLLLRLAQTYRELLAGPDHLFAAHAGDLLRRMSYYQRLVAWALAHDEPGLPYRDRETSPEPPAWTERLSPLDLVRIIQAHRVVNGARIQLTMHLLETTGPSGSQRPGSWRTLLAVGAEQLGVGSRTLARDYTLESVVAQIALAREAERETQARAAPPRPAPTAML